MTNFSINKHLLSKTNDGKYEISTEFLAATKNKNKEPFKTDDLQYLVLHYTAGRDGESSARHLSNPNIKASAHLVINRDGSVLQLLPFDMKAWHAGRSSYDGKEYLNKYSIGIEMDNAGVLTKKQNGYISWFGKSYADDNVMEAMHRNETTSRYWHIYTPQQIEVCQEISSLLVAEYGLTQILGHEEISPGRKQDPGPAFPLDKLRDVILSAERSEEELPEKGIVTASHLNIRKGPDQKFGQLIDPLPRGTEVQIVESQGNWFKVKTEVEGWVSRKFILAKK